MGKKNRRRERAPDSAIEMAPEVPKMDFDTWFAVRQSLIPAHHRKEILRADFYARGLDDEDTQDAFDAALKMYGVNISL